MPLTPLEAARSTLRRAENFLRDQSHRSWLDEPWTGGQPSEVRTRLLGNWLNEIDRLLHGVLDEAARAAGTIVRPAQRNTANKLASMTSSATAERVGDLRLRALARSRTALFYTHGIVTRPDLPGGRDMRVGWTRDDPFQLHRIALGERVVLDGSDLRQVCDFYGDTADRVCASPRYSASSRSP